MNPAVIAVGWAFGWLALLLTAADWPPPVGFVWLLPMLATGAVIVWWRAQAYRDAYGGRPLAGYGLASRDGILAGLAVGGVLLALPGTATRAAELPAEAWVIFVTGLAVVGMLNGVGVRWLAGLRTPSPPPGD